MRKRETINVLWIFALLATAITNPAILWSQIPPDSSIVQDLDTFIARAMATDLAPGLAVAVVRGNDVIYAKGFGFADKQSRQPVTADTQFYIASTTKSFTALAGTLLASRGLIDLDSSLSRALPRAKFHPQISQDQITLRDLLTHTHGIMPGGPVDFRTAYTGEFTNDQLLDLMRFHGPAPTAKAFSYSNLGYNIFALVLDGKFEEGWKQVLQHEVFEPLGMRSTTAWMSKAAANRLAQPYELRPSGPQPVPSYGEGIAPSPPFRQFFTASPEGEGRGGNRPKIEYAAAFVYVLSNNSG